MRKGYSKGFTHFLSEMPVLLREGANFLLFVSLTVQAAAADCRIRKKGIDGFKKVKGIKRHIIVDSQGNKAISSMPGPHAPMSTTVKHPWR